MVKLQTIFVPNKNTTICFSGHRTFSAGDDEGRLAAAVQAAYADGCRTFISGMAAGFDLAAAETVLQLRDSSRASGLPDVSGVSGGDVRLICAVPFAGQARDFSAEDRRRWEAIVAAADVVEMLAERYSYGVFYQRNEWMVARSGRLICWYDAAATSRPTASLRASSGASLGALSGASSGTRHTVRAALASGLAIVNLFRPADSLF